MSIYMPSNIYYYYDEGVMQTIRLADVQLQTFRKYIVCKPIRLHKSFLLKHNNK